MAIHNDTGKYVDQKASERAQEQKKVANKEKVQVKEHRSLFDRALEQSRMQQQNVMAAKSKTELKAEKAVTETEAHKEKFKEKYKTKEKDLYEEKQAGKEKKVDEQRNDDMEGKRVVGKDKQEEEKGDKKGGGRGSSGGGGMGEGSQNQKEIKQGSSDRQSSISGIGEKFKKGLQEKNSAGGQEASRLSQAVLDQLVRYVRIGINRAQEKEVLIDLHELVFKGLSLRLTQKNDNVEIQFMTKTAQNRLLFEANKQTIKQALVSKGIRVEKILVS